MASTDIEHIGTATSPTKADESAAALESRLQQEIDDRMEERFYFILFVIIVFDVFAFSYVQHWIGMGLIFFLEMIFIIGASRKFGVEQLIVPLERLFNIALTPFDRKPRR